MFRKSQAIGGERQRTGELTSWGRCAGLCVEAPAAVSGTQQVLSTESSDYYAHYAHRYLKGAGHLLPDHRSPGSPLPSQAPAPDGTLDTQSSNTRLVKE